MSHISREKRGASERKKRSENEYVHLVMHRSNALKVENTENAELTVKRPVNSGITT